MATRRVTCRSRSACRRGVPRAPVCRCALAGPGRPSSASQRTLRSRQPGGARRQAPGAAATELAPAATAFEELAAGTARKYVMVSGKGGVGKTSLAASLAVKFAAAGHNTLVVSTDPAHSLSDSLDQARPPGRPLPRAGPRVPARRPPRRASQTAARRRRT